MYCIWNFRLRCATRAGPASCVYGYPWFAGTSKGCVHQSTVDGLPRALQSILALCWCLRLRCATRAGPASCAYGSPWSTGMSNGGVRQTTAARISIDTWFVLVLFCRVVSGVQAEIARTSGVSRDNLPCLEMLIPCSRVVGAGCLGTLGFRDGRSRARIGGS